MRAGRHGTPGRRMASRISRDRRRGHSRGCGRRRRPGRRGRHGGRGHGRIARPCRGSRGRQRRQRRAPLRTRPGRPGAAATPVRCLGTAVTRHGGEGMRASPASERSLRSPRQSNHHGSQAHHEYRRRPEAHALHDPSAPPGRIGKDRPGLHHQSGRGAASGPLPHPPFNTYVRLSRIRLTDDLHDLVTLPRTAGNAAEPVRAVPVEPLLRPRLGLAHVHVPASLPGSARLCTTPSPAARPPPAPSASSPAPGCPSGSASSTTPPRTQPQGPERQGLERDKLYVNLGCLRKCVKVAGI